MGQNIRRQGALQKAFGRGQKHRAVFCGQIIQNRQAAALEIVAGGVVDDLSGDKERMENARAHMAKAAEGMSVIAKALCSMVEKLENAEQTAAKYGRMGG